MAILEFLASRTDPVDEEAIHEAVEGRKAIKERALRRLVGEGKVTRAGAGKRGDPFRYSISPSLPPTYIREEEKRNAKSAASNEDNGTYSPSRESAPVGASAEFREGESDPLEEVEL